MYNFTIVVYDIVGQTAADSVFLRVIHPPTSTQPLDYFRIALIIASVASSVVIIAAVLRIYRYKKTTLEDSTLLDEARLNDTSLEDSIAG
ncbi:MAG: hypothetical protein ACFFEV_08805 [Candidatus Thorarchaeota archaeon]